jgi:hypothetical protein
MWVLCDLLKFNFPKLPHIKTVSFTLNSIFVILCGNLTGCNVWFTRGTHDCMLTSHGGRRRRNQGFQLTMFLRNILRLGNDRFGSKRIELLENFSRSVEWVRGGGNCAEHRSVKAR